MREVNGKFLLFPSHTNQRNSAERAIQTFKEHFIYGLASTNKEFLLHLWCQLIPYASLALNLLHQWHMNPKLYGYAQLNGEFNYKATPLSPTSTQVILHDKPIVRGTWASHGVKVWYLGPSMEHNRCHCVYVTKTRGYHESECLNFSHTIIHSLKILPQIISSSQRTNWPMPCRTQHSKHHFATSKTSKCWRLINSQVSLQRLQLICTKE